jgi:ubiquinone/menaquinone biosynthesis C-methylase UbiE
VNNQARKGKMSDLEKAVRFVSLDWRKSPYYDNAEPAMEYQMRYRIWPHIKNFDLDCVLDLACGHGRNTDALLKLGAKKIYAVDVNIENINYCKERFQNNQNVECVINNGANLSEFKDNFFTTVYSWDAMVHFDMDVVRSYIREFFRVLTPNGQGFMHHSNYDLNPGGNFHDNPGWRNFMSSKLFKHLCIVEGLDVTRQEIIDWMKQGIAIDCITVFRKSNSLE